MPAFSTKAGWTARTRRTAARRAHTDVASNVEVFARFAQDQYNDMVVLLAALSTKLGSAGNAYTVVDQGVQGQMNAMLDCGRFVAPESR
ncbi:hypothetical protein ACIOG8_37795 [Streptomyces erythrochromogenes]|uniref:hypothetical protein n=1 Tax=Streptomyces erythrochromogenes TaxID=285574 RepID=UPI003805C9E4